MPAISLALGVAGLVALLKATVLRIPSFRRQAETGRGLSITLCPSSLLPCTLAAFEGLHKGGGGCSFSSKPATSAFYTAMPAMLPIFALLPLLLLGSNAVLAAHVRCSWKEGPGSPSRYGYRHFCLANTNDQTASSADYKCQLGTAEPSVRVADWGKSGAEKLEWRE